MKCRACNIREAMPRNLFCEPCCETPDGWTARPTVDGFYWTWDRNSKPTVCEVSMREEDNFAAMFIGAEDPVYAWEFGCGTAWFGPIAPPRCSAKSSEKFCWRGQTWIFEESAK